MQKSLVSCVSFKVSNKRPCRKFFPQPKLRDEVLERRVDGDIGNASAWDTRFSIEDIVFAFYSVCL